MVTSMCQFDNLTTSILEKMSYPVVILLEDFGLTNHTLQSYQQLLKSKWNDQIIGFTARDKLLQNEMDFIPIEFMNDRLVLSVALQKNSIGGHHSIL